jgi:hypothetical protein
MSPIFFVEFFAFPAGSTGLSWRKHYPAPARALKVTLGKKLCCRRAGLALNVHTR